MRLGALLPFAALGVLVVVASSAALFSSTRAGLGGPVAVPSTPTASGTPRAVPELSRAARLAYWREGRLWISGLDGSLRRALAPVDDPRRITDLLWSPDGEKIAYIDAGQSVVVMWLDGDRRNASLNVALRDQGWRISDIRWAPGSRRIAATFLRPAEGTADAFMLDLEPALAVWSRVTALGDLFASDWISDSEFLASTGGGVIAVVSLPDDLATLPEAAVVRPISGALGTSPILASDGRVHFLAGRVPSSRDPALPFVTASRAYIWSATLDGSDVRRESEAELNDIRLDARLPDGRYLVHRGGTSVQYVWGELIEVLPTNAGLIERIRLAPDGRTAYGFTRERVVQVDLSKLGLGPPVTPEPRASVFLDTSGDADIWFPREPIRLAATAHVAAAVPPAKYAFTLGGHVFAMGPDGAARLLRPGQAPRRTVLPLPRWSPEGGHLLAVEQAGLGAPSSALIAVRIDAEGEQLRLSETYAASRSFAWSPDGEQIAVVVDARNVNGLSSTASLQVRFLDRSGARTRGTVPGSEVAWTERGLFVLRGQDEIPLVVLYPNDELNSPDPRVVVDRDRLARDHFTQAPEVLDDLSGLAASPDGSWLSVALSRRNGETTSLALIDEGGTVVELVPAEDLADVQWSPTKPLLGYTDDLRDASERAVVHAPGNGPVTFQSGRFAGWSLDGEWFYVARMTGLFAFPVAGGEGVRVASVGTAVSLTLP